MFSLDDSKGLAQLCQRCLKKTRELAKCEICSRLVCKDCIDDKFTDLCWDCLEEALEIEAEERESEEREWRRRELLVKCPHCNASIYSHGYTDCPACGNRLSQNGSNMPAHVGKRRYQKGTDLTQYLARYDYFPELTDFVFGKLAQEIRRRGHLYPREVSLIYVWKNFWRINLTNVSLDDEQRIKKITERIFTIDHFEVRQAEYLLEDLKTLYIPSTRQNLKVASAILAVALPEQYGIVDAHVGNTLGMGTDDAISCVEVILEMRRIAEEQKEITGQVWTPRMVDMALWALSKYGTGC